MNFPYLSMATVFFFPILVEKDQHVQPTVQLKVLVMIEIDMNAKLAARHRLM